MIAEQLKKAVLQAAIQGKLTQQLPEDGNARALLNEIQREKQRLIKARKIKKEKPILELFEDDRSFEIPESWIWVTLAEHTTELTLNDGNWVLSDDMVSIGPVKLVQLGSIGNCRYIDKGFKYLTREHFCELNGRQIFGGSLLVNRLIGDKMLCCILPELDGILMTAVDVCCISQDNNFYNVKYLMYILASDDFQQKVKLLGRGTTRFRISKLNLVSIPFPLPPLAEQIRIVARLENLYSEIDKLKSDEYRLEELQKSFPKKMKDSILQYAIQGKLTDQLPEDGDARDLLKEIQKEKARLIKEGKIKNEKPLSDIDEEEIPYDIPDNWCWVRLGEITRIINGFTPPRNNPDFWSSKDISWFTVNDIRNQGHVITSTKEYISKTAVNGNARIVPAGSVLLCCTASIGEYAFTEISLTTNQQFNGITVKIPFDNHINAKYIYYYVQTLTEKLLAEAGKTTFPFLSTKKLADFIIPIAPFKEQTRIIKCIEMLLLQIDKLKND